MSKSGPVLQAVPCHPANAFAKVSNCSASLLLLIEAWLQGQIFVETPVRLYYLHPWRKIISIYRYFGLSDSWRENHRCAFSRARPSPLISTTLCKINGSIDYEFGNFSRRMILVCILNEIQLLENVPLMARLVRVSLEWRSYLGRRVP